MGSRSERMVGHTGTETAQTPTGGSSEGFCAMAERLTQRHRVSDEGLRIVKLCQGGRGRTVPPEEASANYVPAAAVRRRGRALPGITGRKELVGGIASR